MFKYEFKFKLIFTDIEYSIYIFDVLIKKIKKMEIVKIWLNTLSPLKYKVDDIFTMI